MTIRAWRRYEIRTGEPGTLAEGERSREGWTLRLMGQADADEKIPDAGSARVLASGSIAAEHTHRTSTWMPFHP